MPRVKTGFFIELPCDEYMNVFTEYAVFLCEIETKKDATPGTLGATPSYHIKEPSDYNGRAVHGFTATRFTEVEGPSRKLSYDQYVDIVEKIRNI